MIYREQGLVTKLLRDLLTEDFIAIRIDDKQEHQRVVEMVGRVMPALAPARERSTTSRSPSSRSTASRTRSRRR